MTISSEHPPLDFRAPNPDGNWRNSKWLAVGELLVAALLFVAARFHDLPLGRGPWLLALGWISLAVRRIGWRGVGFRKYGSWAATLGIGVGCGVLMEVFELFVSQPALVRVLGKTADLSQFREVTGNLKVTALYIVLAWIVAAFGEELIYRGY